MQVVTAQGYSRPIPGPLMRHAAEFGCLISFLFILQTSLVPYNFQLPDANCAWRPWLISSSNGSNLPDVIGNIFLYAPLGCLLGWWLRRRLGAGLTTAFTLVICGSLSLGIEVAQYWLPSRISSCIDVVCNLTGAALGLVVSFGARAIVPKLIGAVVEELAAAPRVTAIKGYCLVLAIFAAAPFSFAFDRGSLKQAAKNAKVVPFSEITIAQMWSADSALDVTPIQHELGRWQNLKRFSRWAAECGSFVILGFLLFAALKDHYQFGDGTSAHLVLWIGGVFALTLSCLNLLVVSRGVDVTDSLFRFFGLVIGVALGMLKFRTAAKMPSIETPSGSRLFWIGIVAFAGVFIGYNGLLPFRFEFSTESLSRLKAPVTWLPLLGYFETRYDRVFEDVVEKVAAFAVFGALVATAGRESSHPRLRMPIAACLAVAAAVELLQVFIPVRVPSVGDVLLAALGGWIGVWISSHVYAMRQFSVHHASTVVVPLAPGLQIVRPEDALLASLSEPHPGAPVELPHEGIGISTSKQ